MTEGEAGAGTEAATVRRIRTVLCICPVMSTPPSARKLCVCSRVTET